MFTKQTVPLTIADYKHILEYYHATIPTTNREIKLAAERLMNEKMCRCIKRIQTDKESTAIAVCTNSIFNSKGLRRGSFRCGKKNNKQHIVFTKAKRTNQKTKTKRAK